MEWYWVCLQLTFEGLKDFNVAMSSRLAALSGSASLIAIF